MRNPNGILFSFFSSRVLFPVEILEKYYAPDAAATSSGPCEPPEEADKEGEGSEENSGSVASLSNGMVGKVPAPGLEDGLAAVAEGQATVTTMGESIIAGTTRAKREGREGEVRGRAAIRLLGVREAERELPGAAQLRAERYQDPDL